MDGISFHSKREAKRYRVLRAELQAGLISGLRRQVPFRLHVWPNKVALRTYRADFVYIRNGQRIVEDVKGYREPMYKLKCDWMLAEYGITILET